MDNLKNILLPFLIVLLGLSYPVYFVIREIKKTHISRGNQKDIHRKPQPYRSLTLEESSWLQTQIDNNNSNRPIFFKYIVISIIIAIASFLIGKFLPQQYTIFAGIIFLVSLISIIIFFIGFITSLSVNKYKDDLREKVFRVEGNVFKERVARGLGLPYGYVVTVRGAEFNFDELSAASLVNFYNTIDQKDHISVEYSPNTKHIWKISKTPEVSNF